MADSLTAEQSAAMEELIQRMCGRLDDKLDDTVAQINQSVDQKLESGLADIQQRLEQKLESDQRVRTPSSKGKATPTPAETGKGKGKAPPTPAESGHTSRTWADIMSDEEGEASDEEPPAKRPKLMVSEETRQVVKKAFRTSLSNTERKETKGRAPDLDLAETRCPRLDPLFKTGESKFAGNSDAKQVDNDLQKVQALMLDVTAPLLELKGFVEAEEGTPLSRHPSETVNDALKLLGNAIASTSKIRRKRVLKACNPNIQDLAEEESLFEEAGPGPKFETKMKERAESVKILSKSQQGQGQRKFFRGGHHSHGQRGVASPQGEAERGGYSYSQAAQGSFQKKQNK